MTENTPTVAEQAPETPAVTTTEVAATPAPAAQTVTEAAPQQKKPVIKVSTKKGAPKGKVDKKDFLARREWVNKIRQENQEALRTSGYKSDAIVEVLRFMAGGDEKFPYAKGLKSPLIHMLTMVAQGIQYQTASWNSGDTSQLICLLVDVNGTLSNSNTKVKNKPFMETSGNACMAFIRSVFNKVWDSQHASENENLARARFCILRAINSPKHPESIPARARYLLECIIEITMHMVDPFEGIFHNEVIPVPEELAEKVRSYEELKQPREPRNFQHHEHENHEPLLCKKCGKPLTRVREIRKSICENPLCVWGTTKEDAIARWNSKKNNPQPHQSKKPGNRGPHEEVHSRVPADTTSAVDKFKAKYARVPRPAKTIASAAPKNAEGKTQQFGVGGDVWAALDGLKGLEETK